MFSSIRNFSDQHYQCSRILWSLWCICIPSIVRCYWEAPSDTFCHIGTSQTRDKLLSHAKVKSFLFISKNQLLELFFHKTIKEFDQNGTCTTKIGGIIGSTVENVSIVSMYTSEVFADFHTFWSDGIIPDHFKKGNTTPHDKFRKNASTKDFLESNTDQPWIPTVHPSSTKRLPLAILPTKLWVDPSILTPEAPKIGSTLL